MLVDCRGWDRFGVIKINCQTIKSHDRAVYRLVKNAAEGADVDIGVPESGISTLVRVQIARETIQFAKNTFVMPRKRPNATEH